MTIAALIEILSSYPKDSEIVLCWDGGWSDPEKVSEVSTPRGTVIEIDCSKYSSYDFRHEWED